MFVVLSSCPSDPPMSCLQTTEEDATSLLLITTESVSHGPPSSRVNGELWVALGYLSGVVSLLAFKFVPRSSGGGSSHQQQQQQQQQQQVKGGINIRQRFSVPLNPLTSVQVWTNRNVLEGKSLPFIRHPFEPCIIRGFR